ncbi:MAG TPA: hypothetical protein VMT80_00250 [Candidatus Paceibacterota bacterium]|nr:hypothetical protein [Candidatus Paceibacterota bacterium]
MHHAFVIEADAEEGIAQALGYLKSELGLDARGNPDVVVMRFGLLSVEDARRAAEAAVGAPLAGDAKAIIVSAGRAYHEAQNALLKLFEEPPAGTYLFLILPSLGGLLPTLRSRVQILSRAHAGRPTLGESAEEFLKASREKRAAIAKRLATGKDEDERRRNRDKAIEILSGAEAAAYGAFKKKDSPALAATLRDISVLRGYLYDRSAPVRMILEHLALVLPKKV